MHGKVFRLDKGCLVEDPSDPDNGKYIMPGHPVNCNCSYRAIFDPSKWKET
jgi:uncharacterized protein with gpF-like domain